MLLIYLMGIGLLENVNSSEKWRFENLEKQLSCEWNFSLLAPHTLCYCLLQISLLETLKY